MSARPLIVACLCAAALACGATKPSPPPPSPSAQPGPPPTLRFVQMADTQLGFFSTPLLLARFGYSWPKKVYEEETRNFEAAITAAKRLDPAFVIVCGDLINSPGDERQAEEFLRIRERISADIPVYLVAGNHDVGNRPTAKSLAWYRARFGSDWYAFEHDGLHAIVLNSSLLVAPTRARDEAAAQLAWLESALEQARDSGADHVVVFMHHPLFIDSVDERDRFANIPREPRHMLLDLFERYAVRAVFAGHYHRNAYARVGDLEMITTAAVGRPLGDDPSGYRVVDVYADRFEHVYRVIDALP